MKITTTTHNVNPATELLLCFDVSKARLNLFTRYEQGDYLVRIEDEIDNGTDAIEHILSRCEGIAEEAGGKRLRILAEATGGYELGAPPDRPAPRPQNRPHQRRARRRAQEGRVQRHGQN